ncbi:jasmonic acid-amido synthetase JAR1 isoform X1 [Iris pallida]|uniref:Jasmonic acid-amido synthetase JAR1 isoform X1 n=1 Tax=Iris pallida TaxID=29817 RepID=A0AAX6I284_IRIPA|nr:jasmonic acid-amido synthetase JAR1 isoform X1 [Iris pallida]
MATDAAAAAAEEDHDIVAWFDSIAEDPGLVQTNTLRRIIETNYETEYLRRWLRSDLRMEDLAPEALESLYTSSVPLASHADLDGYIQRIADGDDSPILTKEPITMLSLSSGTTEGRQKYVPFTRFSAQSTLQIFRLAAAFRSRAFPIRDGGRILELIYSGKQSLSRGGLRTGTATTHFFASEEFKARQKTTGSFTCSPDEVISAGDYKQTTYCHLLLGLLHSEQVVFVTSTFAYSLVQAFAAFEELWADICRDIRDGALSRSRVTLPRVREAVAERLRAPDPGLAAAVGRRCEELGRRGWRGVIPALWPNAKYVYSIMTGSMQPYLKKLRHYAGGLALVCADYGSTESWIGANLGPRDPPERVAFTVVPTFSYMEFIPLSRTAKGDGGDGDFVEGAPLPLSRIKTGVQYEVVLTTFTGLYRYRLGDVVEVAGFYKGALPKLSFVCRRKLVLTINIDKNTEKDLQLAVERGSGLLGDKAGRAELVDFTSQATMPDHRRPGHYVVYWEVKGAVEDGVLRECCREMDEAFVDHGYVVSRRCGSIGPLELRLVGEGTFQKILDHYIGNGAAMSQFKTPRCTRDRAMLAILDACTVKAFTSTAYNSLNLI